MVISEESELNSMENDSLGWLKSLSPIQHTVLFLFFFIGYGERVWIS